MVGGGQLGPRAVTGAVVQVHNTNNNAAEILKTLELAQNNSMAPSKVVSKLFYYLL